MSHSHRSRRPGNKGSLNILWAILIFAPYGFPQDIEWIRSFKNGMTLAKERNQPVLVDFWSEWCFPCKQMDNEVYSDPVVIEVSKDFVLIRVDVDSDPATSARYDIKILPVRLFLDPGGTVLSRVQGPINSGALVQAMSKIPKKFEPVAEISREMPPDTDQAEKTRQILERIHPGLAARKVELIPDHPPQPKPGLAAATRPHPTTIIDLSLEELLQKYPQEMMGVDTDRNQDGLDSLLVKVGKRVEEFLRNLPNTISMERIRQERLRPDGTIAAHIEQDVEYLLLHRPGAYGEPWKEDRTDKKGKPVQLRRLKGESFLTSEYALECIHFSPENQRASRFRYLGKQSSESCAHLIAFAQIPGRQEVMGGFSIDGALTLVLIQGIAWVDPKTYHIVRMRTDLLQPMPEVHLTRMTTEALYGENRFSANPNSFWLPREVKVTIGWKGLIFRNLHRYSNYRLFTVQTYEKRAPVPGLP